MRIGVWHNLSSGGAKRALYDQVEGLKSRGYELEAWCPPTADRTFLPLSNIVTEHVVPLDHPGAAPWWGGGRRALLKRSAPLRRALLDHSQLCAEQARASGCDVIFAATCQFFGAPAIARFTDRPSLLYLQEPHRWLYEANPEFPWLVPRSRGRPVQDRVRTLLQTARVHRLGERARFEVDNAHRFDRVLVNSMFSREAVLRIYGLDPEVCYLGVDDRRFRPNGADREDLVLGVGALAPHKNARLIVEAAGLLADRRPRVEWVGASTDERYADEVRAEASRLAVEFRVHERADDTLLVDLLNRAKALVFASRLEPFGLVPLEANACELPVIGVAEGGVRETVEDGVNGFLVGSRPDEIARAMDTLIKDDALRERLGRRGREIVEERWTLRLATRRLGAAIDSMLKPEVARQR